MTSLTDTQLYELAANTRDMLSFERMVNIAFFVLQTRDLPGGIVEFGCYQGHTAALMAGLTDKQIDLYDSFKGLPEPMEQDGGRDEKYQHGSMQATPQEVIHHFMAAGIERVPAIHAKWFSELTENEMPVQISLAHIDCDFYRGIHEALALVYPRVIRDGVIIVDDFGDSGLPGVKQAVGEFFSDSDDHWIVPLNRNGNPLNQCYIIKT